MEATASGLFHDVNRYVDFLVYAFWEIAIALGIIFLIVYFCESVMKEAKYTASIIHEIINGDFSAEINREAMQLSVQLLHEKPCFTVLGLFDLNYVLLQQILKLHYAMLALRVWLLLLLTVAWTVVYRYRRRNIYRLAASIPAPKEELPVIGVAHVLTGNTEGKGCANLNLILVVVHPVDLEMVLKTCLEKDDLHRRRKILVPAFSPKIVENFVEVFSEQSEKLAQRLISCANVGNFSMWPFISTYTLDSVCDTAMGIKINAQGNPDSVFLKSMNRILNLVCERIFHLWLQPEWLFKLFPQLRDVFGDTDRPLEKEDLMKLSYLERVVKESLRLFPPVPFIIRKVLEDTKLPSGRTMPAGSGIVVSIWGLHRDPKYWGPDAEHFDPDRFLPERFNVPPCSYMPFSSGPRNCL
ncbi:Cytochrome CYP341A13, partial [Operophtera brumata]